MTFISSPPAGDHGAVLDRRLSYDQNPAGHHVRRLGHAGVARIARDPAQAVHSAGRRTLDLPDDDGDAGRSGLREAHRHFQRRLSLSLADQLREIGAQADIVLEPSRRDSGPAVAVAAGLAARRSPETVVVVLAADHVVRDRAGLVDLCKKAAEAAAGGLYRHARRQARQRRRPAMAICAPARRSIAGGEVLKLDAFVEKPDRDTAQSYVDAGYFWNSGNFIFRADVMQAEIAQFEPAISAAAEAAIEAATTDLGFLVLDAEAFARAPQEVDRLRGDGEDRARRR